MEEGLPNLEEELNLILTYNIDGLNEWYLNNKDFVEYVWTLREIDKPFPMGITELNDSIPKVFEQFGIESTGKRKWQVLISKLFSFFKKTLHRLTSENLPKKEIDHFVYKHLLKEIKDQEILEKDEIDTLLRAIAVLITYRHELDEETLLQSLELLENEIKRDLGLVVGSTITALGAQVMSFSKKLETDLNYVAEDFIEKVNSGKYNRILSTIATNVVHLKMSPKDVLDVVQIASILSKGLGKFHKKAEEAILSRINLALEPSHYFEPEFLSPKEKKASEEALRSLKNLAKIKREAEILVQRTLESETEKRIEEVKEEIQRLIDDYSKGKIPSKLYKEYINAYEKELELLMSMLK
ncbi:MAG: hypothetical protein ACE5K4_08530 [Candidatus Hydrothermarchaeota archaeon]